MVLKYNFQGLMAAVFATYKPSSCWELNLEIIPKYADYLKSKCINGILVNGTTGEHVLLTVPERKALAESWAEAAKKNGQNLVVQVGGASLPDILELARHAESLKVQGILCLPNLFFKPKTVEELITYLALVANEAPYTPLFYYHNEATQVNLSMSEFLRQAKSALPTLSGVKYASPDMEEGLKCLNVDKDYTVFLGLDATYCGAIALGFNSGMFASANLWPEDLLEIERLITEGKVVEAIALQSKVNERLKNVVGEGLKLEQIKSHFANMTGIPVGSSRLSVLRGLKN